MDILCYIIKLFNENLEVEGEKQIIKINISILVK